MTTHGSDRYWYKSNTAEWSTKWWLFSRVSTFVSTNPGRKIHSKKPKHVKLVVSKNFGGHERIWNLTIAEKKIQRRFFKFTGCKILQNHLIIRSPLRKTYGKNLTLEYVESAHHTLCSWVASPLTQKPEGQKSCPLFHLHHPGVQQRKKIAEMHGGNELMDHVNV